MFAKFPRRDCCENILSSAGVGVALILLGNIVSKLFYVSKNRWVSFVKGLSREFYKRFMGGIAWLTALIFISKWKLFFWNQYLDVFF